MSSSRKVLLLVIALVFAIGMTLTGCGQGAGEDAKNESTPEKTLQSATTAEKTTETAPTELPEVKLSFYFPAFNGEPRGDEKQVFDAANKILKEKINTTVDFMMTSVGEYPDKMKVMMAASEEFDICWTSNWFGNFQLEASKGSYLPLDDLLKNYAPNLLASMSEDIWQATRLSGKTYAIPNQQIFARCTNMQIPKGFADKYGFDYDSVQRDSFKLEDLEPYLEKFKNGEKDGAYPVMIKWNFLYGYYNMETLSGDDVPGAIYLDDSSLKVFNQFESEQFKQHLALMKKWVDNGWFKSKDILTNEANIDKGKTVGVWFGGTWTPGGEAQASALSRVEMKARPISASILNSSGVLATLDAISRTSKNPERAMMFLELLNTDKELFNLLMWGIENKDYTIKNGNYIERSKDSKYASIPAWEIATTFISYLIEGQPEDVWAQTKKVNEDAKASPALGFAFDATPVKTETANCNAVCKEYVQGLTYAILDIDKDYDVFIEKLRKAGSDKIIEEMQKQIDAWKNSK